jgi:16S rRNA (cytidine1402-2'-O)-methyltransferase
MGTLYIVATPLGNLEDITLRTLRVLREVSLVASEDTRTTGQLLKHFEIQRPLISYFEHNKLARLERVLTALAEGDVALVSEAGRLLSDPGYELVRAAIERGFPVVPLPG